MSFCLFFEKCSRLLQTPLPARLRCPLLHGTTQNKAEPKAAGEDVRWEIQAATEKM